jgi:predicted site-specific integrase-resolvase
VDVKGWAAATGIAYATARRRYAAGTLPVPACRLGRFVLVGVPVIGATADAGRVVVYARVSSGGQETDLDGRVARVPGWVTGRENLAVSRVVTEVGSAVNGHREKFLGRLRGPAVSTMVVEHRDRFAWLGAG